MSPVRQVLAVLDSRRDPKLKDSSERQANWTGLPEHSDTKGGDFIIFPDVLTHPYR